jgi:hypothetical protein
MLHSVGRGGATLASGTSYPVGDMTEGGPELVESQWLAEWRDEVYEVSRELQRTPPWRLLRCRRLRSEWRRLGDQLGVRPRADLLEPDRDS